MLTFHTGQKDTDPEKSRTEFIKQTAAGKPLASGGQSMKFYVCDKIKIDTAVETQ